MTISSQYLKYMFIEQKFPELVKSTWVRTNRGFLLPATLRSCLEREASKAGITETEINIIFASLNDEFLKIRCFHHIKSNLWCYELGGAHNLQKSKRLLWGSHIWPPVVTLIKALHCAYVRLFNTQSGKNKFNKYLQKLSNPKNLGKHIDALVEMWPLLRVSYQINTEFEVLGYSPGKKDIDWLLKLPKSLILVDVKNRVADLYSLMDRPSPTTVPEHDPSSLFRSVEDKFEAANPDVQLQGVWIVTHVKQNLKKLHEGFNDLDKSKVHFVILGDDEEDAHILTRRNEDKSKLTELFKLKPSIRFTHL